jgi:lactoylglutathione lyase|tara:strand:+ start:591 stop:974 length:384 start_codon:yes stop_codon:yes gene_type:complete
MPIKFLHTRIRVSNIDQSIEFYEKMGFKLTKKNDKSPAGNQLAFLELDASEHFLELCYSPDFEVNFPEDLIHTCVGVEDIIEYCNRLENQGMEIWPDEWREKFLDDESRMAFVTDPDGYEVEILERQ